ncbi:MAG: DUF1376 domain-containing protein [Desulfurellales bacterium]|nr:MAG: DUF1376 domain-containing protein [Desulfurellales bacterium]
MHYYKRNIGDYAKKAGRLSMLEHGAYTLLLDSCYDREQFPTEREAIEWCWARTDEEIAAVRFVLARFFTKRGDVYVQTRVEEELAGYKEKSETNKRIATEREAKRTNRARVVSETSETEHEAPPNHKPLTTNQEPERVARKRGYTLREWLAKNDEEGRDDIPADGCVMAYANNLHIPAELVVIAWYAYVDKYVKERKRYTNWDLAFLNCVKDGGYGIWRRTPDGYVLTTKGLQAETAMLAEEKAKIGGNGIQALQAI